MDLLLSGEGSPTLANFSLVTNEASAIQDESPNLQQEAVIPLADKLLKLYPQLVAGGSEAAVEALPAFMAGTALAMALLSVRLRRRFYLA
jgi:hypothetical protein